MQKKKIVKKDKEDIHILVLGNKVSKTEKVFSPVYRKNKKEEITRIDSSSGICDMNNAIPHMIKEYGQRLKEAGVAKPHQEAYAILNQILGSRSEIDSKRKEAIEGAFFLRERRMPVERIFGITQFAGLTINTENDVFKPYSETEDMVHYAVAALADEKRPLRILDLGTGTGCILLALLRSLPQATGLGVDISEKAVETARENARLNDLANVAEFRAGNWSEGITEKFDLIISNPPRVANADIPNLVPEMRDYDPPIALDGGIDGLDFFRKIVNDFDRLSNEKALCLCQIGPLYAASVEGLFNRAGFKNTQINGNCFGFPCCITVRKTSAVTEAVDSNLWKKMSSLWSS